jgi:coenzyme F420-reducing hydrogenase beta subunit
MNICPEDAILMEADAKGFLFPKVSEACTDCGKCLKACPALLNKTPASRSGAPEAYALINPDKEILAASSSGGAFSALAATVISDGGCVAGAYFDANLALVHGIADNTKSANAFRGSKYLQSSMGFAFREARRRLESGTRVLFSGTPCQVAGLYGYLGGDHERLVTCDLACHGVPSPKVFRKYLEEMRTENGSTPVGFSFRDKRLGWKKFSLVVRFSNGAESSRMFRDDPYMKLFLAGLSVRKACLGCVYCALPRTADISLADFWGARRSMPDIDESNGVSLVIINSSKGAWLCASLDKMPAALEEAVKYNPSIVRQPEPNARRKDFFDSLDTLSLNEAAERFID